MTAPAWHPHAGYLEAAAAALVGSAGRRVVRWLARVFTGASNRMEPVLLFELAGEWHGLPAAAVLKVVEMGPLSRLPRLAQEVVGITHHRGRVVTVLDLGLLINPAARAQDPLLGRLILTEKSGLHVGLLTGMVSEIITLDPAAGSAPARDGRLLQRVHVHHGAALNIINVDQLFARIARLGQVLDSSVPPAFPLGIAAPAV